MTSAAAKLSSAANLSLSPFALELPVLNGRAAGLSS